jgi:hypothetical protein
VVYGKRPGERLSGMETAGARQGRHAALAGVLVVAVVALLVFPALASAARKVSGLIGPSAGNVSGSKGGEFEFIRGIAVNATGAGGVPAGTVYIADYINNRVQRFGPDSSFHSAWGADVSLPAGGSDFELCIDAADCKEAVASGGNGTSAGNGALARPAGVAVDDDTGLVYVSERDNRRISVYGAGGDFVRSFGFDVVASGPGQSGVGFEICVDADNDICQAGDGADNGPAGQYGTTNASRGYQLAVAQADGNPATGSVFLANSGSERVEVYGLDGSTPANFGSAANFAASTPTAISVDGDGVVYASDSQSSNEVERYDQDSAGFLTPLDVSGLSGTSSSTTNSLAVDPASGNLLVGRSSPEIGVLEFASPGGAGAVLADRHVMSVATVGEDIIPGPLAFDPSSDTMYWAQGDNPSGRAFLLDDDGAEPATVTVSPASDVGTTSATVGAVINPNGTLGTAYDLQVSRNGTGWTSVATGVAPGGFTDQPVTAAVDGLRPNTLYRVRVITGKGFGNPTAISPEVTFLTDARPAQIQTTATQSISPTSAVLSARINAHSTQTSYRFEYGPTGSFTHLTPSPDGQVGAGPDFVLVTGQATGLQPQTTYQYRAIATSTTEGVTTGPTRTFTTPAVGAPVGMSGRGYELVSPPDKVSGAGVGSWYKSAASHTTAGYAAYAGGRFAAQGYFGSVLEDGGYSYGSDWSLAERTDAGWQRQPGINRRGGYGVPEHFRIVHTDGSDDLSLMKFSGAMLKLFSEQEAWPSPTGALLREWTSGRWEPLAPIDPTTLPSNALDTAGESLVARDGGVALMSGILRGLAGPGDPTGPGWPGLLACTSGNDCAESVYIDDVSDGLSDTFPGDGQRSLVNVCTGSGGERTELPSIAAGALTAAGCPLPSGPDDQLLSSRGASLLAARPDTMSADGSRVFFVSPAGIQPNNTACTGSGVVATACPPQLYVRQRMSDGSEVTRWISRSRTAAVGGGAFGGGLIAGQASSLVSTVVFEGASRDGDKVFFRTASPLTPDDPNTGGSCGLPCTSGSPSQQSVDLYMYDLPDGPGADPGDGTLTRISAGPTGTADPNVSSGSTAPDGASPAGADGALRLISDDGSRAYFTTAAPLPDVTAGDNGTIAAPAGATTDTAFKNVYLYDTTKTGTARWTYVTRMQALTTLGSCATIGTRLGSSPLGAQASIGVDLESRTSTNCWRGSDDGSFVSFFTDGRLVGDDPDSVSGDMYGYDAEADDLVRLSAPQGGIGASYPCVTVSGATAGTPCFGDPGMTSASMRGVFNVVSSNGESDSRVVVFESASRLVADDHNDVFDVYMWRDGELSLVSTGAAGADDVLYRGADRTGQNIYLSTRDRLTWEDPDDVLDVYVARVGGGFAEPDPPVVCAVVADACQGPGSAVPPIAPESRMTPPPGSGNVDVDERRTVSVGRLSARARRLAARRGVLGVRVRSNAGGRVRLVARAGLGRRRGRVVVGRAETVMAGPGAATVRLRLSRAARRAVKKRRARLRVVVTARAVGAARTDSVSVVLRRAGR